MEIELKKTLRKPIQVKPKYSYEAMRGYFNREFYSSGALKKNEKADKVVDLVLMYFGQYKSFLKSKEIKKPSFDKGLFLVGSVGTGKTFIFELMKFLEKKKFNYMEDPPPLTMVHASDIVNDVNKVHEHTLTRQNNVVIDDIGKEPKEYGEYTSIKQAISTRYDKALLTHLTSNLSIEELKSMYGAHILDRVKQMCNIIVIDMPSLRI